MSRFSSAWHRKPFRPANTKLPRTSRLTLSRCTTPTIGECFFFVGAPILSPNGGDPGLEFVHLQDGTVYLSEFWIDGSTGYRLSVPKRLRVMAANRPAARSH